MSTNRGVPEYRHLKAGTRYRVARAFIDFDHVTHPAGETWIFEGHGYLPYDSGHTFFIRWDDGSRSAFRMQSAPETQGAVIAALDTYIVAADT